jgi:uncharacterized protein YjbI with pentapeptide repeats
MLSKRIISIMTSVAVLASTLFLSTPASALSSDTTVWWKVDTYPLQFSSPSENRAEVSLPNWATNAHISASRSSSNIHVVVQGLTLDPETNTWALGNISVGEHTYAYSITAEDGTVAAGDLVVTREEMQPVACPDLDPVTRRVIDFKDDPNFVPWWPYHHKVNWSGCDLTGINFQPHWFSENSSMNILFQESNFENTKFDDFTGTFMPIFGGGSLLKGVSFAGGTTWSNVEFRDTYSMENASFENAKISVLLENNQDAGLNAKNMNFEGTKGGIYAHNVDLTGSNFENFKSTFLQFESATLDNVDLSGQDFSSGSFSPKSSKGAKFVGSNFRNLSISGSSSDAFEGADFSSANFTNSRLPGARLDHSKFSRADFTGADLSNATFSGSNLTKAKLQKSILSGADLSAATLDYVRSGDVFGEPKVLPENWQVFKGYLIGPRADLSYVSFFGDDLSGFNLEGANLNFVDATSADLVGTNLKNASMNYSNFVGANLESADLTNAHFDYADMNNAKLSNAKMTGSFYFGANLTGATFSSQPASISRADFQPLNAGHTEATDLTHTNFMNADLSSTVFDGADLTGSNFKNANIQNTSFRNVIWTRAMCVEGTISTLHQAGSCEAPIGVGGPSVPSKLSVSKVGPTTLLSWRYLPTIYASLADDYRVEYSTKSTGPFMKYSASCDVDNNRCLLGALPPGRVYFVRVLAHNAFGWSRASANQTVNIIISQKTLTITNKKLTSLKKTVVKVSYLGGSGTGKVSLKVTGKNCKVSGTSLSLASAKLNGTFVCKLTAVKASSGSYDTATSRTVSFTFKG